MSGAKLSIEELLRIAAGRQMTPAEEFEQRVSFVWGQLNWDDPRTIGDVREQLRRSAAEAVKGKK